MPLSMLPPDADAAADAERCCFIRRYDDFFGVSILMMMLFRRRKDAAIRYAARDDYVFSDAARFKDFDSGFQRRRQR